MLRELQSKVAAAGEDRRALAGELTRTKEDGRIKLYVNWQALCGRRDHPGLFSAGAYLPAETSGTGREHLFGFMRRVGEQCAVVAAPRLLTRLLAKPEDLPLGPEVWQDTRLLLPDVKGPVQWRNIFTGARLVAGEENGRFGLPAAELFADFPVALLLADT